MSEPPHAPQPGQVMNGHQWTGAQWVPLAAPPVGHISNGYQWDGTRWVPLQAAPPAQAAPPPQPTLGGHPVWSELQRFATAWQLTWVPKGGAVRLDRVLATRKLMMGRAELAYRATVTVDDAQHVVAFVEQLAERGAGARPDEDDEPTPGFEATVSLSKNVADDSPTDIAEQARWHARRYTFDFPYAQVRDVVAQISAGAGYDFRYGV